jgi:tetratricopeptide (TPR) repeat protein
MGIAQRDARKYRAAERNLTRALALYRDDEDPASAAATLNDLGELQQAIDQIADARTSYTEALATLEDRESPAERARALDGIGRCHLSAGEMASAASFLRQARDIYARLGSPATARIDLLLRQHNL